MRKRQANKIVKLFFRTPRSDRLLWKQETIDRAFMGASRGVAFKLWCDSFSFPPIAGLAEQVIAISKEQVTV